MSEEKNVAGLDASRVDPENAYVDNLKKFLDLDNTPKDTAAAVIEQLKRHLARLRSDDYKHVPDLCFEVNEDKTYIDVDDKLKIRESLVDQVVSDSVSGDSPYVHMPTYAKPRHVTEHEKTQEDIARMGKLLNVTDDTANLLFEGTFPLPETPEEIERYREHVAVVSDAHRRKMFSSESPDPKIRKIRNELNKVDETLHQILSETKPLVSNEIDMICSQMKVTCPQSLDSLPDRINFVVTLTQEDRRNKEEQTRQDYKPIGDLDGSMMKAKLAQCDTETIRYVNVDQMPAELRRVVQEYWRLQRSTFSTSADYKRFKDAVDDLASDVAKHEPHPDDSLKPEFVGETKLGTLFKMT